MRLAHRGDWRRAPENTIEAFTAALAQLTCDGVEFDVRASRDGVPVVIHDPTLARVQGVRARVSALSADELVAHGVPRLADVCAAVGTQPFLDVELKEWVPAAIDVLDAARGPELSQSTVSSFDGEALGRVGEARPRWRRWLNTVALDASVVNRALELGCAGVAAEWHSIGEASARQVRRAGLELAAWTVRRGPTYRRLVGLDLVAICAEGRALDG